MNTILKNKVKFFLCLKTNLARKLLLIRNLTRLKQCRMYFDDIFFKKKRLEHKLAALTNLKLPLFT